MKNKKGLSDIVTTLIIILLVLVAIGVIWAVVSNLLDNSTNKISQANKCLDIDVRATRVVETTTGNYNVTLQRSSTGEGQVGAKIQVLSATDASGVINFGEGVMLNPLDIMTREVNAELASATTVRVTPYFLDENTNKETLCPTTTEFNFNLASN